MEEPGFELPQLGSLGDSAGWRLRMQILQPDSLGSHSTCDTSYVDRAQLADLVSLLPERTMITHQNILV